MAPLSELPELTTQVNDLGAAVGRYVAYRRMGVTWLPTMTSPKVREPKEKPEKPKKKGFQWPEMVFCPSAVQAAQVEKGTWK